MKSEKFNFEEEFAKCKTMDDLCGKNGFMQKMLGGLVEKMLEQEMEEHLGYKKHSNKGDNSGNSRNGKISKKLRNYSVNFLIDKIEK